MNRPDQPRTGRPTEPVVGLILAGGLSRRMPDATKQLLELGGRPLLQYPIDLLRSAPDINIVVVALGHRAEEIQRRVDLDGCQPVVSKSPERGCGGSITAAMNWIRRNVSEPAGVVLIPGDQPQLDKSVLAKVISSGRAGTARLGPKTRRGTTEGNRIRPPGGPRPDPQLVGGWDIAVSKYQDGIGHPFFFGPTTFDRLAEAGGDKAAWKLIDDPAFSVRSVAVEQPLPADVDTWDDYQALQAAFAIGGSS